MKACWGQVAPALCRVLAPGKGEGLGNVRCQDDLCAIRTKLNSVWDARPRAPQRPVLWFSRELATVSQRGFILKEEENSIC